MPEIAIMSGEPAFCRPKKLWSFADFAKEKAA
jgi:hypothetical protein